MKIPGFQLMPDSKRTDNIYAFTKCPGCDIIGIIDYDQFHGDVSMLCDCGYHETVDFRGRHSIQLLHIAD